MDSLIFKVWFATFVIGWNELWLIINKLIIDFPNSKEVLSKKITRVWNHTHEGNICSLGVWDESNSHLYYSFSYGGVVTLIGVRTSVMHA
jgi:hypothetical protein